MPIFVRDSFSGDDAPVATEAHVSERPSHSRLLGSDGRPLQYRQQRIGFDLRRKEERDCK
jgi:hypothetical protein